MAADPPSPARASPAAIKVWLMALALWCVVAGLAALGLWQLRRDAIDIQARELGLLSLALTDGIDRGLRGAEEGMHAVRAEWLEGRLPSGQPPASGSTSPTLHTRTALMSLVQTLWLIDREGRPLAMSDDSTPPPLGSFAPPLDQLGPDAVAVSRPWLDARTGQPRVVLATRLPGLGAAAGRPGAVPSSRHQHAVDGQDATSGWILAAMPTSSLLGAFIAALPADDARMAVFRNDGVRLAGANVSVATLDEAAMAQSLANRPDLEVRRFRDGSEHLVGMHGLPRYGLQVVVSREVSALLRSWRQIADGAALALLLLLAVAAVALQVVQRANHRRSLAQQALQAQLSRASKLQSLGTLAGGVAHDFNNVLAGIIGFGEMAQDAAVPGSAQARHLDRVLKAALRGKALIERILSFSRGGGRRMTVFELEPVVEEVMTLLSASLRQGVVLQRRLHAPGARVRGDTTQAFEAVMNLCTNAMQSMPRGGVLGVALERQHFDAPRVLSHSQLLPGDYLALTVSDQGGGISAAVMERLFEPFFTTRGTGTGLGLAVVHGVVAEFGGGIDVQSRPGHGAAFTLYLPACHDPLDPGLPAPAPAQRGAGQTLLVVDDEPALVTLAEELLQGLGYVVVGHTDPNAALQAMQADPARYAALITDEVMPGMTGTQLTTALRHFAPNLPVLLLSGYGGALLASRAASCGVTRVLTKPLQRAALAQALAELLA
ncbi:MAG: ATP-binding protein [Leptothrix sp. (in: b-proteobacteria)]